MTIQAYWQQSRPRQRIPKAVAEEPPDTARQFLAMLDVLLGGSSALVGLKDLEGRFVFANRELRAALTGRSATARWHAGEGTPAGLDPHDLDVLVRRRPLPGMEEYRVNGAPQPYAVIRFPYRGQGNAVTGIGLVGIPIDGQLDGQLPQSAETAASMDAAEETIAALKRLVEDMQLRAATDPLTGVWNRARIEETTRGEMLRLSRYGHPVSMVFVDLDNFKAVNDTHGHAAGDIVLRRFCDVVKNSMRSLDMLGRWGGEEFVIVMPNSGQDIAHLLTKRIRDALHQHDFSPVKSVTASFGVAECRPGESLEAWMSRADAALYQAKRGGRDRVVVAVRSDAESAVAAERLGSGFVHLAWHERYECGHPGIDGQHKTLFDKSNGLLDAVIGGRPKDEIAVLIDGLLAAIVTHLSDEEKVIRAAGYPGAAEHEGLHRDLLDKAFRLASQFTEGSLALGDLFAFLAYDLAARHMLSEDRKFFPYLAEAVPVSDTATIPRLREQRRHPRRKTFLDGLMVYEDDKCTMDCMVLDLSESGALVKPGDIMHCPETFRLKTSRGLDRNCEAVRRAGHCLGARFV